MTLTFISDNSKITKKFLVAIYCLFITISFFSCENIIDKPIDPYAHIITEEAVNNYLIGAYAHLADALRLNNFITIKSDDINLQSSVFDGYFKAPSTHEAAYDFDNFYVYPRKLDNFNDELILKNCSCSPIFENITKDFYRSMYLSILMSNKIIQDLSVENKWQGYLGEAYFLRAYSYFKLARVFGRVPLVIELTIDYDLPLAQFVEIYSQIEQDLFTAISYLPENRYSSRKNAQTPHKGTAQALLAEVYLTMGGYPLNNPAYYAKAAETAREVIDNADFYGFGLVDDFANLWQWQYHDNKELVWSIYYQGETFNFNSMLKFKYSHKKITTEKNYFRNFPNNYRKHISFWHYRFVESYEQDDFREEPNNRIFLVFNDATFDESDDFKCNVYGKKQEVNFSCYPEGIIKTSYPPYRIIYNRPMYAISKRLDQNNGYIVDSIGSLNETNDIINTCLDKMENDPKFDPGYTQHFHIFRYAHTLLTYAEASARSGSPDASAYEAVNMVRRRANKLPPNLPSVYDLPPGLSATAFADSVVTERGWEFCHEFEGRWNDIIRLQLYPQVEANRINESMANTVNEAYKGQIYFLPIPEEEIWLNPNLESDDNN